MRRLEVKGGKKRKHRIEGAERKESLIGIHRARGQAKEAKAKDKEKEKETGAEAKAKAKAGAPVLWCTTCSGTRRRQRQQHVRRRPSSQRGGRGHEADKAARRRTKVKK